MKLSFLINLLTQKYRDKAKRNDYDNNNSKKERKKEGKKVLKQNRAKYSGNKIHLIFTVLLNYK